MTETTVESWVGRTLDDPPSGVVCERSHILAWLEATENANALHWDETVAADLTGGWIAPPSMLSTFMRPSTWQPGRTEKWRPLELHFRLKEAFDLPDGVVASNAMILHEPLRPGDRVRTTELVREISEEEEKRLGTGRFWTIDVTYHTQDDDLAGIEWYRMFSYRGDDSAAPRRRSADAEREAQAEPSTGRHEGGSLRSWPERPEPAEPVNHRLENASEGDQLPALEVPVTARTVIQGAVASRDWQPQHHDHHWATQRAGTRGIFLNTPNQAGWIERYLTDWTGPPGRLGRLTFRMRRSICDGDVMTFNGRVTAARGGWVDVEVSVSVEGETATTCAARIAIPDGDNPWRRTDWRP